MKLLVIVGVHEGEPKSFDKLVVSDDWFIEKTEEYKEALSRFASVAHGLMMNRLGSTEDYGVELRKYDTSYYLVKYECDLALSLGLGLYEHEGFDIKVKVKEMDLGLSRKDWIKHEVDREATKQERNEYFTQVSKIYDLWKQAGHKMHEELPMEISDLIERAWTVIFDYQEEDLDALFNNMEEE